MEKYICGDRNSYSKTDHDATFMRLKEDAMRNGQLKPAYNVQHGVDSEYIVWADVSAHPTDTLTLIPFLRKAEEKLGYKYNNIVADAGYFHQLIKDCRILQNLHLRQPLFISVYLFARSLYCIRSHAIVIK